MPADSHCPAAFMVLEQFFVSRQNQQPGSEIILYQTEDGRTRLEVKLEDNTVWLTQQQISELIQRERSVILPLKRPSYP